MYYAFIEQKIIAFKRFFSEMVLMFVMNVLGCRTGIEGESSGWRSYMALPCLPPLRNGLRWLRLQWVRY